MNTPALQECLQRMQARMRVAIATITNRDPGLFVVRVFNYREPLAFSAIGGEILLSKGLILTVEEEDELAAVVAHEISHHLLGHLESLKSEAGRSPSFVFSQETEEAADELSVSILSAAGYDPLASMKALRKLTSSEQRMHREQVLANALANIQQQSLSPKTGRNRLFERVQAEVAGMEQIRPMRDGPLRDWDSQ